MSLYDNYILVKSLPSAEENRALRHTILKRPDAPPGEEIVQFFRNRIKDIPKVPMQVRYLTNDPNQVGVQASLRKFSDSMYILLDGRPSSYISYAAQKYSKTTGAIILDDDIYNEDPDYKKFRKLGERVVNDWYSYKSLSDKIKGW